MAEAAFMRVQLVDNSKVRDDKRRLHKILGWQIVRLPDMPPLLQPTDYLQPNTTTATDKEITGIHFCDEAAEFNSKCMGGNVNGIF